MDQTPRLNDLVQLYFNRYRNENGKNIKNKISSLHGETNRHVTKGIRVCFMESSHPERDRCGLSVKLTDNQGIRYKSIRRGDAYTQWYCERGVDRNLTHSSY